MTAVPIRIHRPGAVSLAALPPLSLYVHLPWCLKKCPYCDFNSHEKSNTFNELRYLEALFADLESALPQVWGRRVVSVFIGGGTPSLFSPESIEHLIAGIRARLPLDPGCEITLEANPGTFERERFRAFRAAGVTRLSVGVQSFDDAMLHAIGRVHDAAQARAAVTEAREAFDTFNIDLMYALPSQTLEQLSADLDTALAFAPPHLSIYHLTIEPNTAFAAAPPRLPDDDAASDMLDLLIARARLSVAVRSDFDYASAVKQGSRIRVATKYTATARQFFADKGVHVDLIKLYGSMELAPLTGLADAIVDIVSTGGTLKANGLIEVEKIADISSRLVVNQAALKLKREAMRPVIDALEKAVQA